MDTLSTNAPSSTPEARGPEALRRLSSVLRPLSSTLLPLALFTVLWIDLIRLLSNTWETREQYAYGWFVPFFAAALLWRRWLDRPAPCPISAFQRFSVSAFKSPSSEAPPSSVIRHPSSVIGHSQSEGSGLESAPSAFSLQPSALPSVLRPPSSGLPSSVLRPPSSGLPSSVLRPPSSGLPSSVLAPWPLALCVFLFAFLLLPLRVIFEINADWPLICWVYSIIVVGLTLFAFQLAGGWTWVRHFAFPVAFILVAIAWPYRIEKGLTQDLMQVVASLTVELLGWMNIPAMQQGNLIALSTGTVGIDEACSGIRSFQSSLMAGLLMGELYRLRLWTRVGLVGCGIGLAFGFNVVRTLLLTWQADKHGLSAIDKWHDPAGMSITVACFFGLWAVAVLIERKWGAAGQRAEDRGQRAEDRGQRAEDGGQKTEDRGQKTEDRGQSAVISGQSSVVCPPSSVLRSPSSAPLPAVQPSAFSLQPSALPCLYLLAVGCWAVLCLAATEAWYRLHEINQPRPSSWAVTLPEKSPSFQIIPVTPAVSNSLKNDVSFTGKWQERDGSEWTLYFFRWNPHSMQSVISARLHRPEVCLPGAGLRQISMSPLDYFKAGPLQIPFHKYTFEAGGQQLYVFFSLWQDGDEQSGMRTLDQSDRIRWVLAGRRHLGQQTLEIICTGYPDMDAAEKAVRERLPELIRIESHKSAARTARLPGLIRTGG